MSHFYFMAIFYVRFEGCVSGGSQNSQVNERERATEQHWVSVNRMKNDILFW